MVESALRKKLMGWLKEAGFFAQAVESSTNPGIPDVWYAYQGVTGWLELKLVKVLPKRAETSLFKSQNHPLAPEQENWITRSLAQKVNVAILVGYERKVFLIPGYLCEQFNDLTWAWLQQYEISRDNLLAKLKTNHATEL